jgi:hypothetical protein
MTLQEILSQIESIEFQANISSLSGFRTVLTAFSRTETLQQLLALLRDNPGNQQLVLDAIEAKLPDYQPDYAHPHDITVAALVYALVQVESSLDLIPVIELIASKKELFWARYMAQKIISEKLQKHPQKP